MQDCYKIKGLSIVRDKRKMLKKRKKNEKQKMPGKSNNGNKHLYF